MQQSKPKSVSLHVISKIDVGCGDLHELVTILDLLLLLFLLLLVVAVCSTCCWQLLFAHPLLTVAC